MQKTPLNPCTLNILATFLSWQIIHLKNVDMYTLWGGGESEKLYVLYTHLNVGNYGQLLKPFTFSYIFFSQI